MATLFSKIVAGDIPCYKIAENEEFLAFLDIMPLKEGHTLIIPKVEIDYLFDIEDDLLGRMMIFAKNIALALKITVPCKKIGVTVIGLEVPHAHIHLVPMNSLDDMNFAKPKLNLNKEEMSILASKISSNLR